MSDEVVVTPPVVPPAATPGNTDPSWLNPRLEQAKRSEREAVLKELGVTDVAAAKAAVVAAAAAAAASKTAEQRAAELETKYTTATAEQSRLQAIVTEFAARKMMGLTPEQKVAVEAIAGNDPASQMKAINALTPTWAAAVTQPQTDAEKAAAAALAAKAAEKAIPGATTAPAGGAPPAAGTSHPDHKSAYEAMQKVNPFAAARYADAHAADIFTDK